MLAAFHIISQDRTYETLKRFWHESQIWIRLMAIFAFIWILTFALTETTNVFTAFFDWPIQIRYPLMTMLSLLSAVTDNVALAAMQAGLILNHPLPGWAIRFLFIMLTWAGGLTAFGCLQSLALHAKRPLSMGKWFREARGWAVITLIGGLIGRVAITLIYPAS
jgi:predicted cation transporter